MLRSLWKPDNSSRICHCCHSRFTFFRRRHHCRACGELVCWRCSDSKLSLHSITQINAKLAHVLSGAKTLKPVFVRSCKFCVRRWEDKLQDDVESKRKVMEELALRRSQEEEEAAERRNEQKRRAHLEVGGRYASLSQLAHFVPHACAG